MDFLAVGSGIAEITLGYAVHDHTPWSDAFTTAHAAVSPLASGVSANLEKPLPLAFDGVDIAREGRFGAGSDMGFLSVFVEFSETDSALIRVEGTASAAAVAVLATPLPGALPMMLGAICGLGIRARRR